MKKLLQFLRSMRFGILLLGLIGVFSLLGSVIPQDRDYAWYVQNYGSLHWLILAVQLHRVFKSWYFLLLMGLLCLNLTLCSLLRIFKLVRSGRTELEDASRLPSRVPLEAKAREKLEKHLAAVGCRQAEFGPARVYYKNRFGRYGSFITHLAILLTVLFGAAALYLPRVTDLDCMPGETLRLGDGTQIRVESFSVEDDNGHLDYASVLRITLADGRDSGERRIRVNYPLSFGPYKIYQQTYGTAGSVTVTNTANGGSDDFVLSDPSFLSLDNVNGLWFLALYPDYLLGEDGRVMPVPSSGSYDNPVYYVQTVDDGAQEIRFLFPGDTLSIGALTFRFNEPLQYPGLRIKHTPTLVNALLIASFALMILGLTVTFFLPPVLVKVDETGYTVAGPKPEGMRIELRELLKHDRKESAE